MFLMARRARTVLHDVRLVKRVARVTGLALLIDRFEWDSVLETFLHDGAKFLWGERSARHQCFVVTARTIITEAGVFRGNFSRAEKSFTAARLINPNRDHTADDRDGRRQAPRTAPRMHVFVITEISFVALGDLLLRSVRGRHVPSMKL